MSTPFTPKPDDGAITLLRSVFGKVVDGIVAGNSATINSAAANMLGEAYRYFNSGVLMFGSLILMYMTVAGISNTANDGEVLGKRWSTFYTPIRTLTASFTLIPTSSGYAGIQIILLTVVCYSVGFASNMWTAVVSQATGQEVVQQALKSIANDPNFESLAVEALRMQVCAAGVNTAVNSSMAGTPVNLTLQVEDSAPSSSTNYIPLNGKPFLQKTLTYRTRIYYKDPAWSSSENICGQVIMTSTFDAPDTNSAASNDVARSLNSAIANIRNNTIKGLFQPNTPTASIATWIVQASNGQDTVIDTQQVSDAITQLKQGMMDKITAEVTRQAQSQNTGITEQLSSKGWIYAGSLYMELSRIKDSIRAATTTHSEYIAGTGNLDGVLTGDVARAVGGILNTYNVIAAEVAKKTLAKQTMLTTVGPHSPTLQTNFTMADFTDGGSGFKSGFTSWVNQYSNSLLSGTIHYMSAPDEDPVLRVKNLGDWLTTGAETAILAHAVAAASIDGLKEAASAGSNQPGPGALAAIAAGYLASAASFMGQIWGHIQSSIYTIMYAGYYLGVWIPMVPFLVFALGTAGWLVYTVEMLAAGVLWMAAHITPAREDSFIGSQAQGYMLVVSGFFRPPLMILGLVASIALLGPLVTYLNEGFLLAVRIVQTDSLTGIVSLAGFLLVYCFMITALFAMVFSLPQSMPDRILKWINAGTGDLGEQHTMQRLENSASSQARTAAVGGAALHAAHAKKRLDKATGGEKNAERGAIAQLEASAPEGLSGQSRVLSSHSNLAPED